MWGNSESNAVTSASPWPSLTVRVAITETLPMSFLSGGPAAAHEGAGTGAGVVSVAADDLPAHDGGGVPVGGLEEPSGAGGEVVVHLRAVQHEVVEVDHVEVALL